MSYLTLSRLMFFVHCFLLCSTIWKSCWWNRFCMDSYVFFFFQTSTVAWLNFKILFWEAEVPREESLFLTLCHSLKMGYILSMPNVSNKAYTLLRSLRKYFLWDSFLNFTLPKENYILNRIYILKSAPRVVWSQH